MKKDCRFEVYHQPPIRTPYADLEYVYVVGVNCENSVNTNCDEIVNTGISDEEVENWCYASLHPCSGKDGEQTAFGQTYYKFKRIGKNEYLYIVVEPNCD